MRVSFPPQGVVNERRAEASAPYRSRSDELAQALAAKARSRPTSHSEGPCPSGPAPLGELPDRAASRESHPGHTAAGRWSALALPGVVDRLPVNHAVAEHERIDAVGAGLGGVGGPLQQEHVVLVDLR